MKKKFTLMILILALFLSSISFIYAQKGEKMYKDYSKTNSGLKYLITQKGAGENPVVGSKVKVHYTGKLEDGTQFDSSYDRGEPIEFELGTGRVIKGWDEGIALLNKGAKATFVIPPELGYGSRATGPIPANSVLIFDVELVDFSAALKIEPYKTEGKKIETTMSGLKYVVVEKGRGEKAKKGDLVSVHYSGYLKDGSSFDSSVKRNKPFQFSVGRGSVIKGWDEGLQLMHVGDKIRFIIPYNLAYGEAGRPPIIPEKAELTFDIELLEIK